MNRFHHAMRLAAIEEMGCLFDEFNERQQIQTTLQYFIGGSERFGYSTEASDVDIFVHVGDGYSESSEYILSKLAVVLLENGFECSPNNEDYSFANELYHNKKYSTHVLLIHNGRVFDTLKEAHFKIQEYLADKLYLTQFISEMKTRLNENGLGKHIFRSLFSLAMKR